MTDFAEDEAELRPDQTYELRIVFDENCDDPSAKKESVKEWLTSHGVESFVEGAVDSIDIEHDYENPDVDRYESFGGDRSPVSVYKYDRNWLVELRSKLFDEFQSQFVIEIYAHDTKQWTEGWKESFKPFGTEMFYVRPPWEGLCEDKDKHELIIDPGMAFGTGQHATTRICLLATERLFQTNRFSGEDLLDVGTGSGILAIAANKIGISKVTATDIDPDSVISARKNAEVNHVELEVHRGSVIQHESVGWAFMYANILSVVLKKIMPELFSKLKVGGLVVMSGIIAEEEEEMIQLTKAQGFELVETLSMDGWIGLVLQK